MQNKLMTFEEVQERLNVSRSTVHRLREAGKLHSIKIGTAVRFEREEVERFLDELRAQNQQEQDA